jgi:hypothetical protein
MTCGDFCGQRPPWRSASGLWWFVSSIASAETSWKTAYLNLIASQQSQLRARRAVALIDLTGDGTPEMVQMVSVGGNSRTCRLKIYSVKSGDAFEMSSGGFDFSSHTFPGVRSVSFALRASSSLEPAFRSR